MNISDSQKKDKPSKRILMKRQTRNVLNREKGEFSNIFKTMEKFLQSHKKNTPPNPEGSRLSRLTEEIKDKEVKVHVVLSI